MLTLQFIPYSNIASLDSAQRIKTLLEIVKDEKIVLLEGRLREEEEAELIKKTMESIDEKFTGIELGVIYPEGKDTKLHNRIRRMLIRFLLGNRNGFTIIGPANIIKEIKKDPDKIQLFTKDAAEAKPKKKKK
ncbi:DUF2073 domain-containing protein [Candidatus Woesearchaeota archaeon]|nr:DUF2073 domain-containing protein [Candidatus Woesearchaeota archaeon]